MFEPEIVRIYCVYKKDKFVHGFAFHKSAMSYLDRVRKIEPLADWSIRELESSADWIAILSDFASSVNFIAEQAKRSRLALALLADSSDLVREAISSL